MVDRIIAERQADGQFDECDLTLRDLDLIREAFVAQLLGMYHRRIEYPAEQDRGARVAARAPAAADGGRSARRRAHGRAGGSRSPSGPRASRGCSPAEESHAARARALGRPARPAGGAGGADPVRRRRAGAAERGSTWATRGPTDVLSFPLLPPGAFPPHPGATRPVAQPSRRSSCPPGGRCTWATSWSRSSAPSPRPTRAGVARRATSAGRRPTSCGCS